ncbi:membrane-bound lytic murein transglycosylase MltF [Pseudomaricurvus alkylphenolicus]|jgi:membrane-bound lytic murein transglycosylase F|uniref:membrane-bound lytic murein transglycosylase MltF n=1 Tax=Pseudomaricurvus alkylphenolicus TaxID=1306991 RepID=UPI001423FA35|nr:membrane-bound lytic murein transglycosylase MltF [Pseudomaricurvus alkylphenolicus]NIB43999.1 membrane-bound lytic murein transglycosylase MltF [Pseudomaricurvus alkylphenolicus]
MRQRQLIGRAIRHLLSLTLVVTAGLFLSASHTPTALEQVLASGELTIISRNGPTTYYEDSRGMVGYEYTLAKAFADDLGVKLNISEEENLGRIFHQVGGDQGQLAAAGLAVTDTRQRQVRFTASYMEVTQQVIYRTGTARPRKVQDLIGKSLLVISNSAQAELLREMQRQHPKLRWHEQSDLEILDLMEKVHKGEIDFAVVSSNAFDLNRALYPRAKVAFDVSEPQAVAWAFPKGVDDSLLDRANGFIARAHESGMLQEMNEYYYGHVDGLDAGSALTFARRLQTRLPRWQEYLQIAGDMFDLDWQLLAAISYQESHWNSRAQSYTGVRGLMMLTKVTAAEMGVENRLDPIQSIYGGAKYFKKIFDRIPQDIQGADRTWLALAAYNVGFGHMEDARVLTERMGRDPDKWVDVREHLPLLAKRKYYRRAKHGYARGWEPVQYVQRIRSYYNTIAWHQQVQQRRMAQVKKDAELVPVHFSAAEQDSTSLL